MKPERNTAVVQHPHPPAHHGPRKEYVFGGVALLAFGVAFSVLKRKLRPRVQPLDMTPAPIPANNMVGDFEVLGLLADGGTATIYRGEDGDHNMVAIKIPHRQLVRDRKFVETFQREAEVGVALRHPSIVRVLQASSYRAPGFSKVPFFVMEHLEGQELEHWLREHGAMDAGSALKLVRGIADALQWAHQRGVTHRDISPRNIFITSKRTVKVMDFGISATSSAREHGKGISYGTPEYLAPERINNPAGTDVRSDLYALGCVFYEMLVGFPPFQGNSPEQTVAMHLKAKIPSVRERVRGVSPEIEKVVHRLLAKNPDERYQTAAEVVSALAEATPDGYEVTYESGRLRE